jgi:hypothetical protein
MGDTRKVIKIGSPHVRLALSFCKIDDIEKEKENAQPILGSPYQFIRRDYMGDTRKQTKIGSPHVNLSKRK